MVPVQLRGHHFLCMLTYRGFGYSAEFTANMATKISYIRNGAEIRLVEGADDICVGMSKACSHVTGHDCGSHDIMAMDLTARRDVEAALGRDLDQSAPMSALDLSILRNAFANGSIRAACEGCSWFEVCNSIVAEHYFGTQLLTIEP